jgi:hypothetical protein
MIKYYDITPEPTGGTNLSPDQRTQWNGFLDFAKSKGTNLDKDPNAGAALMAQYKKANPDFSLTAKDIPQVQQDHAQLRTGDSFGGMAPEQLNYLRQGMNPSYLNRPVPTNGQLNSATANLYYPQTASHGTDIEGYYRSKVGLAPVIGKPEITAPAPTTAPALPLPTSGAPPVSANIIPRPNYADPKSRSNYLANWQKQYGPLEGRGDHVLRVNEVPAHATHTAKDMATSAAKPLGLDPSLFYASAMEEGLSGLYKNSKGELNTGYQSRPEGYTIDGNFNFGLDTFSDFADALKKKGYLPKNFQYAKQETLNEKHEPVNSAFFKNTEDAMTAKAAMLKYTYDKIDSYAKQQGIPLSPKARDFFSLAEFNGGNGRQMLNDYHKAGYLEGDKFLNDRPTSGGSLKATSYGPKKDEKGNVTDEGEYAHIIRRIKMAERLKEQQLF